MYVYYILSLFAYSLLHNIMLYLNGIIAYKYRILYHLGLYYYNGSVGIKSRT